MGKKLSLFRHFWVLITFLSAYIQGNTQHTSTPSVHLNERSPVPVQHFDLQISEFLYIQPVGNVFVIIHRRPDGVSVMNQQGELETRLGRDGRGPFEWRSPAFIQYNNGEIIIWDAGNLKFLVFDENFEPVRENIGIRHAISGFNNRDRDLISVYNQPAAHESEFIHIYERASSGDATLKKKLGNLSDEGRTMLFLEMMGGLLWNEDDLIWVDPAVPGFFVYKTRENKQVEFTFRDGLFSVDTWVEPRVMTSETLNEIEEYLFSNSRIVSLQKLKNHILLEVEHFRDTDPVLHYHLYDFDYNYITYLTAGEGGWENYIRGVDENRLFYWGEDYMETGENGSIRIREVVFE